jgi:hypothetical protein
VAQAAGSLRKNETADLFRWNYADANDRQSLIQWVSFVPNSSRLCAGYPAASGCFQKSAYARNNRTKRALWEYDNIIQSLYLLKYIDSAPLRQNVQRAVNRGENYHQLRRAVSYANFGKLRFRTEYEQLLWSECSRLIANCIIYYKATILSHLLAHKENTGDRYGADLVKEVSPVAWQHINLYGRYEFREQPAPVDVREIERELADVQIETDSTLAA